MARNIRFPSPNLGLSLKFYGMIGATKGDNTNVSVP